MLAVVLLSLVVPAVAAQPIRDVPGFRGLRPGNHITVLVASSRQTDISIDGQPEVTQETSESLQIQYRVIAVERSGDVVVKTIVSKIDRQPPSSILTRLAGATFSLTIHPDGNVSTLTAEGRDAMVMHLSNGDPESAQILRKCLTDEAIASWFSIPFWMIRPVEDERTHDAWERSHDVSLGTLGSLHLDLNFQAGDIEGSLANVVIAGDAHFRPLVLPDTDARAFPFLSNASVEVDEVSGTGRLYVAEPDADEPPQARPEFESVDWTLRLHGEAELPLAKVEKTAAVPLPDDEIAAEQEVSRKSGTVTFRQSQHHAWTLQSFSIGMPGMFGKELVPIPVQ